MSSYFYDKGVCKTCGNYIFCDDRGSKGYYLICSSDCHSSAMFDDIVPNWVEEKYVDVNSISFW